MAKLSKQQKQSQITGADTVVTFMEYLVTIMCLAIVVLVPLYMKNAFYEIGQCKYDLYYGITRISFPILMGFAVIYFFMQRKELSLRWIKNSLNCVDVIMIGYLACSVLSYVLSDYKEAAWTGYAGWNMGLYSQITFGVLYFFVSRFAKDYKAILAILLGASTIVIVLGILNRFLIDPIGVYEGIAEYYYLLFLSTLGQSSWYSSFLCVVLPIGVFAFWYSEKKMSQIVTGIYVLLGFMSLVTQNSDSAYLAFLGMMLVLFWFSMEEWNKTKKLVVILFLFGLAAKIIKGISLFANTSVIVQLDKLSLFLINGILPWILMIICVLLYGVFTLGEKTRAYPVKVMKTIRNILYCMCGAFFIVAIVLLVQSTQIGETASWASIPYLVWNDHWGNGRGFTWKVTWTMFSEMNLLDKLFGVGSECYPYYAYEFYKELVESQWGSNVLTNAHNEWFNAVINYGVIGGGAYLAIFISGIVSCAGKAKKKPELIMVMACVVAYMCHNLFCYQQVLCTPFVMILLGIGQYIIRKAE